jgi:NAD(P)-dependent dehydrogenase (short-subunit alcohol dehydrogenase family)
MRDQATGFVSANKWKLGLAAIGGLVIGKKLYDGPVFNEAVDLTGQTVVITGGNTGLGKEAAVKLASLNAETIILCRNPSKAKAAIDEIKMRSGNSKVSSYEIDLSDLESVDKCVAIMKKDGKINNGIDVLMLNAGVMAIPEREVTAQNFEKHMGINHLSHFALTAKLFPFVEKSKTGGRIVTVSSSAHLLGKLDQSDLLLAKEGAYQPWPAYGNSKLANILFCRALASKLQAAKSNVIATVCHPGACRTELGRYIFDPDSIPKFLYPILGVVGSPVLYLTKSPLMGAQTQIYLSASKAITTKDNGVFFDNSQPASTSAESQDMNEAMWLWKESEKLTGVKFDV